MRQLQVEDSDAHATRCKELLDGSRSRLVLVAKETLDILEAGAYSYEGRLISIAAMIEEDLASVLGIPPDEVLSLETVSSVQTEAATQVRNTLTLTAARELVENGKKPLVLNFANGTDVGGGFLRGAKAQEETLCYVSSLFCSIVGHPFYDYNSKMPKNQSSDYAIISSATVFRDEAYRLIPEPWKMDVLTCAAPIARLDWGGVSPEQGAAIMDRRIARILDIAIIHGFTDLVLGAWGCGAFGNDPEQIANLFEQHLRQRASYFDTVVFAIADWSSERRFLQPFARRLSNVKRI